MKKMFILNLVILASTVFYGQSDEYIKSMKLNIDLIDAAESIKEFQQAANQFSRVGDVMENEWLPYYYCAYCYTQISHLEKEDKKRDLYLDKAQECIDIADKIVPENSEIYVMKGFILQARMKIDPMIRGLHYNKSCLAFFEKAKIFDPQNPRSYLWHGVNLFNTPTFMGGGKKKALPLLELAIEKFNSFKPISNIHPNWGRKYAEDILTECRK